MRLTSPSKTVAAAMLSIASLATVGCPDDDLIEIAPSMFVDVCAGEPQREIDGVNIGGISECAMDFGTRDLSVRSQLEFTITNPSSIDLSGPEGGATDPMIIETTGDTDPAFKIEVQPVLVESGLSKKVLVTFRPTLESEVRGRILIRTDAENVLEGEDVIIELTGTGVDNGVPNIEASPLECKYGRTAVNSVKECAINIKNTGTRDLVFDGVFFLTEDENNDVLPVVPTGSENPEVFGFFGRPPTRDDVVPAPPEANEFDMTLRFEPDALGVYTTALAILTNDPDTPEIIVPLDGIGVDPPLCDIKIESVNGIEGNQTIEPLDNVILSANDSSPSTASGEITEVRWEIVQQPPGSTATLTSPSGLTTGFTFDDDLGIDLTGAYRVRASVVDEQGTVSVNPCELSFDAIPSESFLVELSWDTSSYDMDLHLTKRDSQGRFCTQSVADGVVSGSCSDSEYEDCYFGSCKATASERPDWDDDGNGTSEGDPSLDIDDLSGYGPENTNIVEAVEGEYLVGVDYWGGTGPVGNTLRVYLYGQLAGEFYRELNSSDFWEVAVIKWPADGDGVPCLEDLSTAFEECP